MTPCEEKGYKVGDRFVAKRNGGSYLKGDPLTLKEDDGTEAPYFKNERSGHNCCAHLERIEKSHGTNPHLRPGDYVSTKGMTEEQYHAVAKAFMEAGAKPYGSGGKHKRWSYVAWDNEGDFIGTGGNCGECKRKLTIEQVLGESPKEEGGWIKNTSGEQPVEDGTMVVLKMRDGSLWRDGIPRPAEVIGWWFSGDSSDVVEYKVVKEDETQKVQDVRLEDGPPIKRQSILDFMNSTAQFIELEGEETDTIQSLLKKADKHARKAQKHEAKRQEAIKQARALLPDGWELTETGVDDNHQSDINAILETISEETGFSRSFLTGHGRHPGGDLNDPDNWREGDVVECIDWGIDMTKGRIYEIEAGPISGRLSFRDDAGDYRSIYSKKVRFHHRP